MIKKKTRRIVFLSLAIVMVISFMAVGLAQAQSSGSIRNTLLGEKLDEAKTIGLPGSEENSNPIDRVVVLIRTLLGTTSLICLIIIIYAGFKWMTSGGNEETIAKARKTMVAAAVGLAIIFLSYSVTLFIFNVVFESRRYV